MKKIFKKIGTFFADIHESIVDFIYDIKLTYNTLIMFYFNK